MDSGAGTLAEKTLARVRQLSDKPIQYILNTGSQPEHTGGNVALRASGGDPSVRGSFFALQFADAGVGATIIAHQNVQNRMVAAKRAAAGVPSDTYLQERRRTFHNGDAIEMFWQPRAVTDGDSIVHFRRADVIVTGDVFTTTQYPPIDVANGGSVQGEINALNDILARTVYQHEGEGGTIVVPGHGYVSDEHEVVEYRDMVAIVRDRVQAMIRKGATLDQVTGGEADRGLRHAVRLDVGCMDDRSVRGGRVCESQSTLSGPRCPSCCSASGCPRSSLRQRRPRPTLRRSRR